MSVATVNPLLQQLDGVRAFIVCRLVPQADGSVDKVPVSPRTLRNCDPHSPDEWMLPSDAAACATHLGEGYYVGVVISEQIILPHGRRLACLDLDSCRTSVNTWMPHAESFLAWLPGALIEVSVSGNGLHVFFCYNGERPVHGVKNRAYRMELYSRLRFILCTGYGATGNALIDHTAMLHSLAREYFPPHDDTEYGGTLTTVSVPDWLGPDDDDELLRRAFASQSPRAVFGGKAAFADLWNANAQILARVFPPFKNTAWDESAADLSLANWLAFYTGNFGERMERLMRRSQLARSKWDRPGYLHNTIQRACASTRQWYKDSRGEAATLKTPSKAPEGTPAADSPPAPPADAPAGTQETRVTVADFYAYLPDHKYIFIPTGELWPAEGVNAKLTVFDGAKPSQWLDQNRSVTQMTWAPGESRIISNRVVSNGEWIERADCACFNLYRPPSAVIAEAGEAQVAPWLDHLRRVYSGDVRHLVFWFAHRVQRPGEKINHALVLGGSPGIGKDTILEPVRHAVGAWNFGDVSPGQLLGRFNGFLKSVILRVSEARDQGEQGGGKLDRFAFYEHTKTLCAAPPTTLLVDEKNVRAYPIMNVLGMVITTNHRTDGIFLPPDDRRHYVAWSEAVKEDFSEDYWRGLWSWYAAGGYASVAAYLARIDISEWDAKAPPPKTEAFWAVVDANKAPEDAELADALDLLMRPPAITVERVGQVSMVLGAWLSNPANRRKVPHRFESAGYVPVRNDVNQGLWVVKGKRQTIYGRSDLAPRERFIAAAAIQ